MRWYAVMSLVQVLAPENRDLVEDEGLPPERSLIDCALPLMLLFDSFNSKFDPKTT
jgi:hypothetical protein